jgi:flagellar protein FliS
VEQNMNYSQAAATYRTARETVQKTRQVVLLYDAVIRFLQQARQAIENKEYEARFNLLNKSSVILIGLQGSLDFENGGEISKILSDFYSAIDLRIQALNRTNDLAALDQIVTEIKMMRDAWDEVCLLYTSPSPRDH